MKLKKRVFTGLLAATMLSLTLTGCGQEKETSLNDMKQSVSQGDAKASKEKLESNVRSIKNPKYSAERFLSWIYEGKSTGMQQLLGIDRSTFEDDQLEFFEERAGSVTPVEYPLIIKYENFYEVYQPDQIKEEYAQAMVAYFEQIGQDYKVTNVEKDDSGAEVTVESKGLAMKALASQANGYMDKLVGFDQNMALSKYPSSEVQKANAVLQFWAMGQLYKQGNTAPMLDNNVTYTFHLEKDSDGNYKPSYDALGEVYSGSKQDSYETGK
ncbi:hypothetical protein ACYRFS_12860 [Listeria kieliensis]